MENKHTSSVSLIDGHIENITDAEIVKALECCGNIVDSTCKGCVYHETYNASCVVRLMRDALDLIKRQQAEIELLQKTKQLNEAEIERFTTRQKPTGASGFKNENGKVVFFANMLSGYRHEYTDIDQVVKTLNELLHEAYSKDEILFHYNCAKDDLRTAKSEAIQEFWKRFDKVLCENIGPSKRVYWEILSDGNNLVKEMTEDGAE